MFIFQVLRVVLSHTEVQQCLLQWTHTKGRERWAEKASFLDFSCISGQACADAWEMSLENASKTNVQSEWKQFLLLQLHTAVLPPQC